MSFFEADLTIPKFVIPTQAQCGTCGLHKTCKSPKMQPSGDGRKGVLVVAEAPGADEDDQGTQLVGKSGQLLWDCLKKIGVNFDRDCWRTNSLICRPPDNETPTDKQIDYCRPNLYNFINQVKPRVIIPLGGPAIQSLVVPLWREGIGPVRDWVGWKIPLQSRNCWVCPTYHPSYISRQDDNPEGVIARKLFGQHLEQAFLLDGRPYEKLPEYKKQVKIVMDPEEVAHWIDKNIELGGASSFDYETDRLKPDREDAEIVSCAICWAGRETIAYPMVGAAVDATRRYITSEHPKIGANNKFEDRWSKAKLGHFVNNWVWDCMTSAHHLDNRGGITSVKFQAFVRLGFEPWDLSVKPYLEAVNNEFGANTKNRINEIPLRDLLMYNGLDAVVEYELAKEQRKEMKYGQPN